MLGTDCKQLIIAGSTYVAVCSTSFHLHKFLPRRAPLLLLLYFGNIQIPARSYQHTCVCEAALLQAYPSGRQISNVVCCCHPLDKDVGLEPDGLKPLRMHKLCVVPPLRGAPPDCHLPYVDQSHIHVKLKMTCTHLCSGVIAMDDHTPLCYILRKC